MGASSTINHWQSQNQVISWMKEKCVESEHVSKNPDELQV